MTRSLRAFTFVFLLTAVRAFGQDAALYVVTHVDAEPNFTADTSKLLRQFASEAKKDPNVIRIEILEETARPNHFTMVEVWQNQKVYEAHLAHGHTKDLKAKLLPMLGSPLDERLHKAIN